MAGQDLTFNGLNLQSAPYSVSKFVHEGISTDQAKMKIPHRDGNKLTSYTYGVRPIHIEGVISAADATTLDANVDTLKQYVIGAMSVPLIYDYNGGSFNRLYTVNATQLIIARDFANITYVPYSIDCEAINPPFAQASITISGYNNTSISGTYSSGIGGQVSNLSFTASGTANPQPVLKFTVNTKGSMTGFQFNNTSTSTAMRVNFTPANADVITIDCQNYTITQNSTVLTTYSGIFPTFIPGTNNFTYTTYG